MYNVEVLYGMYKVLFVYSFICIYVLCIVSYGMYNVIQFGSVYRRRIDYNTTQLALWLKLISLLHYSLFLPVFWLTRFRMDKSKLASFSNQLALL